MKLTMLGTGNAMAMECYMTCFTLEENNDVFLVDGGGGNTLLKQLKIADIDWRNIHTIFITHKHIDHLLGIIWMLRLILQSMRAGRYEGEVTIYGHDEVITVLREMTMKLFSEKETSFIDHSVHFVTVHDSETKTILNHEVTFFDIHSTKAKQYGFTMKLDDMRKLTCCGDEPYNPCEEEYVRNSAWLLHEAFCLYRDKDLFRPYEKHHSTVKDACELSESLNVQNLILYHTEDQNIEKRKELYTKEGKQYYSGNLIVPDDLETFEI